MSDQAVPARPSEWEGGVCPLCGAAAPAHGMRCPECNYYLAGVGGRPRPASSPALWWSVAVFVVVFLGTLGVVALSHS